MIFHQNYKFFNQNRALYGPIGPYMGPWGPIWAHKGPMGPYGPQPGQGPNPDRAPTRARAPIVGWIFKYFGLFELTLRFLIIFLDFLNIFGIVGPILCFLAPGRSESCRRLRDLQKSIVILSNVWTRNVTLLMKTLPPLKMII